MSEIDPWDPRWASEPMPHPHGVPLGGPAVRHGQLVWGQGTWAGTPGVFEAVTGHLYSYDGWLYCYRAGDDGQEGTYCLPVWRLPTQDEIQRAQLDQLTGGGL